MTVPFLDLKAQYRHIQDEIQRAIDKVLSDSSYVLGPAVQSFEERFADYCQASQCIGVSSGTAALHLALRALDIGPGDEVITVPNTFIATVWAISYVGAQPVFVDVDPKTYTIDPSLVEEKISTKTRAIIPVHLYGHPADLDSILDVAARNSLYVIEDAAQAHGAEYRGCRAGSLGDIACFSFYPGKNLGAYGEAGAIVTGDPAVAERVRQLRNHAQSKKYHHCEIGYNYRMDGIQGAVLGVKLSYLDDWNEARRNIAARYRSHFEAASSVWPPYEAEHARHVYHLYELQLPSEHDRGVVRKYLEDQGIATGLHYPIPVHLQEAYGHLGYDTGDFPISERSATRNLSLPLFPEMTNEQVDTVAYSLLSGMPTHA